jgi:hypothetical protein
VTHYTTMHLSRAERASRILELFQICKSIWAAGPIGGFATPFLDLVVRFPRSSCII